MRITIGMTTSLGRRTTVNPLRPSAVRPATAPTLDARSIWLDSTAFAIAVVSSNRVTSIASSTDGVPCHLGFLTSLALPLVKLSMMNGPVPTALAKSVVPCLTVKVTSRNSIGKSRLGAGVVRMTALGPSATMSFGEVTGTFVSPAISWSR